MWILLGHLLLCWGASGAAQDGWVCPEGKLDRLMQLGWREAGVKGAGPCSDAVFLRRAYLDLIGTLPEPWEVNRFLNDPKPEKRSLLIDALLERDEYADYWAMRWSDALRVKSEFPINLWPNAVQAYHRWIRDALGENVPYDQFARSLLTSSGSNFRVPPVNFYRAVQGEGPEALARAVALTFLASRLDTWPDQRKRGMIDLFSRVAFKGTAEWKEEVVMYDPSVTDAMRGMLPDGSEQEIGAELDPRTVFADWLLLGDGREWFSRAMVNRSWACFFGRGFVHQPDDIHPENPPQQAEAFDYLAREFAAAGYDIKALYRLILNSRVYQQSCLPSGPKAEELFACYPVRRMDAEVLIDALCQLTGTHESYMSPIPEPFTYVPESQRTIALNDGSITSSFLEMFGRPPRDSGRWSERNRNPTAAQSLHLLNSTHVQRKIERSWKLRALIAQRGKKAKNVPRAIYIAVLSRPPSDKEVKLVAKYFKTPGMNRKQMIDDLIWALINSKEFLYHH